jgi:hypothetical protein
MAKLSISIPDDLVDELHAAAHKNVSAFVATAVRHELDRRRLLAFLDEVEDELGPVDEDEVASFNEKFSDIAAATSKTAASRKRPSARSSS